jgi:mannose/cellobiose epimerase-like protein (N-acyl-D-glucosamine 2-epimerase family)
MTLSTAQNRVRDWLFRQALPLWADAGIDAEGRFFEKLDFDGRPITGRPRRTRVQARQVYVFAEAVSLGWGEGVAFVLFALAAAHRVLKDERARPLALSTLAAIEARMADPVHGGWQEALPPVLPRRQNPHMHMLEALLAWQAVAPDPAFEAAARRVLDLFDRCFFDREHLMLGEFYDRDWTVRPGSEGQCIEPGHHMEWVWLLGEAARLGLPDLSSAARALYTSALT